MISALLVFVPIILALLLIIGFKVSVYKAMLAFLVGTLAVALWWWRMPLLTTAAARRSAI